MFYTVTGTIQSLDTSNPPMEVQWYGGNDLAQAMAALVSCAAHHADPDCTLPASMQYQTLNVHMQITECVWERNQYQPWARVPCSGTVTEVTREEQTGLLCEAHVKAWDEATIGAWDDDTPVPEPLPNPVPVEGL